MTYEYYTRSRLCKQQIYIQHTLTVDGETIQVRVVRLTDNGTTFDWWNIDHR